MKQNLLLSGVFTFILCLLPPAAAAQLTITLPKLPDIKRNIPPSSKPEMGQDMSRSGQFSLTYLSFNGNERSAGARKSDCTDPVLKYHHLKELKGTLQEATEFSAGRGYYVSTLSDSKNVYLEAALSPSRRKTYYEGFKHVDNFVECMGPALDELAAVARKTLPSYTGPTDYTFGTPAEKKALLGAIDDIADAKVLKVGMKQANWLIAENDYGLPTARYKHGVIWTKYPNVDHGFCWLFRVNLKQDYAGGGTYGASYGYFISRALAGCPADK